MFACLLLIVVPKPNIGNGRPHPPITTPLHPSLSVHMPIRDPNQCCVADNNNNKKKLNRKNRREGFGYNKKKNKRQWNRRQTTFHHSKGIPSVVVFVCCSSFRHQHISIHKKMRFLFFYVFARVAWSHHAFVCGSRISVCVFFLLLFFSSIRPRILYFFYDFN